MSRNLQGTPLVKIVYAKVQIEGKVKLIAFQLFADGSLEPNS